ncbi:IKBKE [Cordylochernes scorpioides]|uniref:IKBKE n=1 Tax=Cordylochernes scorpioides TaxID=51811 RepID=A0ABY6K655_9ARAC|nr:IKBKE [Cordylochernes scorpioides]
MSLILCTSPPLTLQEPSSLLLLSLLDMRQQLSSTKHCLQSLQAGLAKLPDRWTCPTADRWKEKAHTYVTRIRESWQVLHSHKLAKKLSFHDEQFHMLEKSLYIDVCANGGVWCRVKIQHTSQKLVALLNEQNQFCQSLLVSFNRWHRDLEEVRSQCLSVEEELANAEMMVKAFNDSLLELSVVLQTEEEAGSVNSKLSPPQPSSTSLLSKTSNTTSMSRMNMIRSVKEDQQKMMDILSENNHLNQENHGLQADASQFAKAGVVTLSPN